MNWRAFAAAFALTLPFTVVGVAEAAPQQPTGSLTVDGATVTAEWFGVKRSDRVRLQALCQTPDTGVVWMDVRTVTSSPTTVTYAPPTALACRTDLFVVSGGNRVTYLDWAPLG